MIDAAIAAIHRPEATAIDHVNWTVQSGDYWIVGGLPGSGKTDLLSTAAGLMRPKRGIIRLFGEEPSYGDERKRLAVQLRAGIVFGSGGRLFNELTVAENLALPLCYHQNCVPEASQERVVAVLTATELTEFADVTPVALTRNLRQRTALARALVLGPELLFLDNPLAETDPRETRWWLAFLDRLLAGKGLLGDKPLSLAVATDDLKPWGGHGRQFAYLHNHQFVAAGSRTDLLKETDPALRELLPLDWLGE